MDYSPPVVLCPWDRGPLPMGFSKQEYWSGFPCPPPGDLPDTGIQPSSLMSLALADMFLTTTCRLGSPVAWNLSANARDLRGVGPIPGWRRSLGRGHSNPFQYSCLENPMSREGWQVMVHRVAKSQTRMKQLMMHTLTAHGVTWQ